MVGSIYQGYELIPHRLNQFVYASFRHTFRNNDGYQYGDEYILNAGLNLVPVESVPWVSLTTQLNYRYLVHDVMVASQGTGTPIIDRGVPNTGASWFGVSPGVLVSFADPWQAYFMAQVPLARQAFDKSLSFNAHDSTAYENLGILALNAGYRDVAVNYFAEALWLDPGSQVARQGLAQARR